MEMVLLFDIVRARREESTENSPSPLNERDRKAADEWIREHLPDPDECSLEDSEEAGSTESYFFLRLRDSATVVYKVAVKDARRGNSLKRMAGGVVRPFIWCGSLTNALSRIGNLAAGRSRRRTLRGLENR